jgi:hypothetical protein
MAYARIREDFQYILRGKARRNGLIGYTATLVRKVSTSL